MSQVAFITVNAQTPWKNCNDHCQSHDYHAIISILPERKEELKIVKQKMENEREDGRKKLAEKDKFLSKRALHINTLQGLNNFLVVSSVVSCSTMSRISKYHYISGCSMKVS